MYRCPTWLQFENLRRPRGCVKSKTGISRKLYASTTKNKYSRPTIRCLSLGSHKKSVKNVEGLILGPWRGRRENTTSDLDHWLSPTTPVICIKMKTILHESPISHDNWRDYNCNIERTKIITTEVNFCQTIPQMQLFVCSGLTDESDIEDRISWILAGRISDAAQKMGCEKNWKMIYCSFDLYIQKAMWAINWTAKDRFIAEPHWR